MEFASDSKNPFRFHGRNLNSLTCKYVALVVLILLCVRVVLLSRINKNSFDLIRVSSLSFDSGFGIRKEKFLEVPQIVWGLNNQKIAFARACLTARTMNRTFLMPSLSASLFYKEIDKLEPIWFDKVFEFDKFNSLCNGFVQLGRYSDLRNRTGVYELQKGSGRKWTLERDLNQLRGFQGNRYDEYKVIRIVGKNPFLWHDHWPVTDYARVFECLVLVEEIANEASRVVSKIRELGSNLGSGPSPAPGSVPYIAVHMRIEIDWMIHCKKLEKRLNITQICSSKAEIIDRVGHLVESRINRSPTIVYLAMADSLLEDSSILTGWENGLLPYEKKKLGVDGIYKKYPISFGQQ